jgi:hypothetical protein
MWREILPPVLFGVAAVLSLGVSGGQIVRCVRRKSSDDVTIAGWLSGAGACACLLSIALITRSSMWIVVWEAAGIVEYSAPAAVAWWYRSGSA